MDLDQQIQLLIDQAPQDGQTPQILAAIAPSLKILALQLRHPQYYILQTLDGRWVLTTLTNRAKPSMEKQVIYAFPTLEDATTGAYAPQNAQIIAAPVFVTHILFQMVAIEGVDSLIFFETEGNLVSGTEVRHEDIQNMIRTELKRYLEKPASPKPGQLPPDIA